MSEPQKHAALSEVLATARAIVNHKGRWGAIGVPVSHVVGMAHALCALHDIAESAAEMLAASERSAQAITRDDIDAEVAEFETYTDRATDLADGLIALGLLTLVETETNDERAQ